MLHSAPLTENLPYPVLVADIGGTNARFALIEGPNAPSKFCGQEGTKAHATIQDAIRAGVLEQGYTAPRSAVLAVAAPVSSDRIALTNARWVIEPPALIRELGLEQVVMLNDFEAQGLALPSLSQPIWSRLVAAQPCTTPPSLLLVRAPASVLAR